MITRRQAPMVLAATRWRGACFLYRDQSSQASVIPTSLFSTKEADSAAGAADNDIRDMEADYAELKVNWFPGHMVKATKVIREKLKQV